MHIPSSMLHGQMCPVTLTVGAVAVVAAARIYSKSDHKILPLRWAGVTALIFVLQMLNFPVIAGTSGHLIGGVLAACLLGIPAGILSMGIVLLAQAVFLADGGMNALGANVINMALIGVGGGGLILQFLKTQKIPQMIAMGMASFVTVIVAALSCSVQVAISENVSFVAMAKAMSIAHIYIGLGEGILTVSLWIVLSRLFSTTDEKTIVWRTAICGAAALALVPFASSWPDGFEMAARTVGLNILRPESVMNFGLSFSLIGVVGVMAVWILTLGLAKRFDRVSGGVK